MFLLYSTTAFFYKTIWIEYGGRERGEFIDPISTLYMHTRHIVGKKSESPANYYEQKKTCSDVNPVYSNRSNRQGMSPYKKICLVLHISK